MAQTKVKSNLTVEDILAGIDERVELLTTIKAAMRYAFTSAYQEDDAEQEETLTQPKRQAPRRRRTKIVRGTSKPLFAQCLQEASGPLTTAEVYAWLKANNWHTSSGNPKYLVAVTLRNMAQQGLVLRGTDGRWSLMPTNIVPATEPMQQVA